MARIFSLPRWQRRGHRSGCAGGLPAAAGPRHAAVLVAGGSGVALFLFGGIAERFICTALLLVPESCALARPSRCAGLQCGDERVADRETPGQFDPTLSRARVAHRGLRC